MSGRKPKRGNTGENAKDDVGAAGVVEVSIAVVGGNSEKRRTDNVPLFIIFR